MATTTSGRQPKSAAKASSGAAAATRTPSQPGNPRAVSSSPSPPFSIPAAATTSNPDRNRRLTRSNEEGVSPRKAGQQLGSEHESSFRPSSGSSASTVTNLQGIDCNLIRKLIQRFDRRPYLHIIVLFAAGVMRYAKDVYEVFLDHGIDVFLETELPSGQPITPENLAELITLSASDFVVVIGDRNQKNQSCQAKKRGKLVEIGVDEMVNFIWSEWGSMQRDVETEQAESSVARLSEDQINLMLEKHANLRHAAQRYERLQADVEELKEWRGQKRPGGKGGLTYLEHNLTDERLASKLTQSQKSAIRLHKHLLEARETLKSIVVEPPTETLRGQARYRDYEPAKVKQGISVALSNKLFDYIEDLIPRIEELGSVLTEFGSPLWSAYLLELGRASNKKGSGGSHSSNGTSSGHWSCPRCTFSNPESLFRCKMCETERVEDEWCLMGASGKKQRKKKAAEQEERISKASNGTNARRKQEEEKKKPQQQHPQQPSRKADNKPSLPPVSKQPTPPTTAPLTSTPSPAKASDKRPTAPTVPAAQQLKQQPSPLRQPTQPQQPYQHQPISQPAAGGNEWFAPGPKAWVGKGNPPGAQHFSSVASKPPTIQPNQAPNFPGNQLQMHLPFSHPQSIPQQPPTPHLLQSQAPRSHPHQPMSQPVRTQPLSILNHSQSPTHFQQLPQQQHPQPPPQQHQPQYQQSLPLQHQYQPQHQTLHQPIPPLSQQQSQPALRSQTSPFDVQPTLPSNQLPSLSNSLGSPFDQQHMANTQPGYLDSLMSWAWANPAPLPQNNGNVDANNPPSSSWMHPGYGNERMGLPGMYQSFYAGFQPALDSANGGVSGPQQSRFFNTSSPSDVSASEGFFQDSTFDSGLTPSLDDMLPYVENPCCFCGREASGGLQCGLCAKEGNSTYFCSPEHQNSAWQYHLRTHHSTFV